MAKNLSELAIGIIDHIDGMKRLQEFLRLCIEELDNPDDKEGLQRIGLLLDSYISRIEYHFDELRCLIQDFRSSLQQVKQLLGSMPVKAQEDD